MTLEEAKKEINKNQSSPTIACNRDYDSGWEDAIFKVIEILEQVDTVPVPKDTMTLTELARELRKVFRFKYLTVFKYPRWEYAYIALYGVKPSFLHRGGLKEWSFMGNSGGNVGFDAYNLSVDLDLSEYADADGEIDYSKCIVEVE